MNAAGTSLLFAAGVAGLVLVAFPAPSPAEIYKWVDDNGEVHFSERRPPDEDVEKVRVRTARPAPPAAEPPSEEEKEIREVPLTPEQKAAKRAEIERLTAAHRKRCEEARAAKTRLSSTTRTFYEDDSGTLAVMPEDLRQKRLKAAEEAITESCNWTPAELADSGGSPQD